MEAPSFGKLLSRTRGKFARPQSATANILDMCRLVCVGQMNEPLKSRNMKSLRRFVPDMANKLPVFPNAKLRLQFARTKLGYFILLFVCDSFEFACQI